MKVSVAGASLHVDVEVGGVVGVWPLNRFDPDGGRRLIGTSAGLLNDHLNDYLWQRLTSSQDGVQLGDDAFQTEDTQDGGLRWTTWKSWMSFHKCSVYLLDIGHTLSDFFHQSCSDPAYVIGITRQPGLFYCFFFFHHSKTLNSQFRQISTQKQPARTEWAVEL